ncbi:hypothetical protein GGR53DRAFT_220288 [Hypoxylon sp. FL1150]|nr:hypothetical protein GGR53DRAFT_220288 [Hypoxylon sp. FL1150]
MSSSARPRRQRAACDRCHALKNRCSPSGSGDKKCDRCHRLNIRCVYSLKAPLGRPKGTLTQAQPADSPASTAFNGIDALSTLGNDVGDDFSMTTGDESLFMPATPPSLQLGLDMDLTFRPTSPDLSYQASPTMQPLPDAVPTTVIQRKLHAEGEPLYCISIHTRRVNILYLETPSAFPYSAPNLVVRPPNSITKLPASAITGRLTSSLRTHSNCNVSSLMTLPTIAWK